MLATFAQGNETYNYQEWESYLEFSIVQILNPSIQLLFLIGLRESLSAEENFSIELLSNCKKFDF